ncbi:hypothetical protein C8J57DRAFT_1534419 [Mycena rebaudengoi]|nr:hypothetical protein C8J57DRAFT_1534419 [Mycena rebaudengoi]
MLRAPLILSLFHLAPYLRALRLPLLFSPSHCALRPFPALDLSLRHLLKEGVVRAPCIPTTSPVLPKYGPHLPLAPPPADLPFVAAGDGAGVEHSGFWPSPVVNAGGPLLIQQLPYNAFESKYDVCISADEQTGSGRSWTDGGRDSGRVHPRFPLPRDRPPHVHQRAVVGCRPQLPVLARAANASPATSGKVGRAAMCGTVMPPPLCCLLHYPAHITHWIFLAVSIFVYRSVYVFHFRATTLRSFVSSEPSLRLNLGLPLFKAPHELAQQSMMLLVSLRLFFLSVVWQASTLPRTRRRCWPDPLYTSQSAGPLRLRPSLCRRHRKIEGGMCTPGVKPFLDIPSSPVTPVLVQVSSSHPHLDPGSYCPQTRSLVTVSASSRNLRYPAICSFRLRGDRTLRPRYQRFTYRHDVSAARFTPGALNITISSLFQPLPFISTCKGCPRKCSLVTISCVPPLLTYGPFH